MRVRRRLQGLGTRPQAIEVGPQGAGLVDQIERLVPSRILGEPGEHRRAELPGVGKSLLGLAGEAAIEQGPQAAGKRRSSRPAGLVDGGRTGHAQLLHDGGRLVRAKRARRACRSAGDEGEGATRRGP